MIQSMIGLGVSMAAPSLMKRLKDQKVQVLHAMPGRVRLQSNHWKDDMIATALEQRFSQLNIISHVQASGITGSLLLEFNTPHLTSEQFDEIVQLAVNTSIETFPHIKSKMKTSMKYGIDSFDHFIKKQTSGKTDAETLLALWLIFKGTTGFSANPAFASSLLYWAYSLIKRDGDGL